MSRINRRKLLLAGMGGALALITGGLWAAPQFLSGSINSQAGGSGAARRTRVTVETDAPIKFRYFTLPAPDRLVIDIEGIVQNRALSTLAQQVPPADSFIANIRIGQKDAQNVRLVFDLKQPVQAKITALPPSGSLKHRLQIDLQTRAAAQAAKAAPARPAQAAENNDPLMAMLEQKKQQEQQAAEAAAAKKAPRKPIIVLDPGHGGKDPGAIGSSGLKEKDVALAVARDTQKRLQAQGFQVYLTRDDDRFISLKGRRDIAHQVKADLFVSIHANASESPEPRGADVFVWAAKPNSERARKLQKAENEADDVAGIPSVGNKNVDMILTDMMRTQTSNDSERLGSLMLQSIARHSKLRTKTVDKADFVVLRSVDIPSVLVELAFLSNPQDEKLLASAAYRSQMADSISQSIGRYLKNAILNP